MALFDLLDSKEKKKKLSHVKNCLSIALADKDFDTRELVAMSKLIEKVGISQNDFNRLMARRESIKFIVPDSIDERREQIFDMIFVMIVDNKIHQNELDLCYSIATKFGFTKKDVDSFIPGIQLLEEEFPIVDQKLVDVVDLHRK